MFTFDLKKLKVDFDLNGQMTILPLAKLELCVGDWFEKFHLLGIQLVIAWRGMHWMSRWHASFWSQEVASGAGRDIGNLFTKLKDTSLFSKNYLTSNYH